VSPSDACGGRAVTIRLRGSRGMCVHPARYVESLCAAGGDGGPL